jgi:hypothetical protein
VLEKAFFALDNLCISGAFGWPVRLQQCVVVVVCLCADENRVLAGRAGAIDAVVTAMREHANNTRVSEQACRALGNLCISGAHL